MEDFRIKIATQYEGGEYILFLRPRSNASIEAWYHRYRLNVTQIGNVITVESPEKDYFLPTPENLVHLEFDLDELEARVVALAQARSLRYAGRIGEEQRLPMLVTDANKLRDFYEATGSVYDDPAQAPVLPPALPGGVEPPRPPTTKDGEDISSSTTNASTTTHAE